MLEINPFLRPSAKLLLQNEIFDSVRINSNENPAPYKIKLLIDQDKGADSYDDVINNPQDC
jgi:hypothetical protein